MNKQPTKYLIFDMSNVLYRTFYANKSEDDITIAGLACHAALLTINKYYNNFPAEKIIMTFDRPNWRVDYTKSDKCLTGKIYKGNRRKDMTRSEKAKYEAFKAHIKEFEHLITNNTTIVSLAGDKLEADDLIAAAVQTLSVTDEGSAIVIVSADKDLIQLLKYPNVTLLDPASGKPRTLDEWDGDADLFMFEKCLRGDRGDNVQSAYPRIRSAKIREAYNDPYVRANIMEHTWSDNTGKEFVVKQLFEENRLLMNLEAQPDHIRTQMVACVLNGLENPGSFSFFNFMKFCGELKLKKVAEKADTFVPMLSL